MFVCRARPSLRTDHTLFIGAIPVLVWRMNSSEWTPWQRLRRELVQLIVQYGYNADANHLRINDVSNMDNLFHATMKIGPEGIELGRFRGDISGWDVSHVTSMNSMFRESSFRGSIAQWDVSNVTNMGSMFMDADCQVDISQWNTRSLTHTTSMFLRSKTLHVDLSNWDVSRVVDASRMFMGAACAGGDLSRWDVGSLRDASSMFEDSPFRGHVGWWRPAQLRCANRMFCSTEFDGNLSHWTVPLLQEANAMFGNTPFAAQGLYESSRTLNLPPNTPATLLMELGMNAVQARQWLVATQHEGVAAFELVESDRTPLWLSKEAFAFYENAKKVLPSFGVSEPSLARVAWDYWLHQQRCGVFDQSFDFSGMVE